MAKKRMFRLDVLETDAFMDMPLTTQALYFHLNLRADDDGFVGNPKMITRNIGASLDDLKLLITKRFVLIFEDGVIVIKHWRLHNNLTANRYTATKYLEDKEKLFIKDNGAYSENKGSLIDDSRYIETGKRQTKQRRDVDETKTTPVKKRIDKNREDKESIGKYRVGDGEAPQPTVSEYQEYMDLWNSIPHTININGIIPMSARDNEFRYCLHLYGRDGIVQAMKKVADSEWLQKKGDVSFDRYMNHDVIQKLLEGTYDKDFSKKEESDGYDFFG